MDEKGSNLQQVVRWMLVGLLSVALFPIPLYGYYVLLRVLTSAGCLYLGWQAYNRQQEAWVWIYGVVALLYNPIYSFHLGRVVWCVVNVITLAILLTHSYRSRPKR